MTEWEGRDWRELDLLAEECTELLALLQRSNDALPAGQRRFNGQRWGFLRRFDD